jgi:hypothetical protein
MTTHDLENRVLKLEGKSKAADVLLTFADGSTRAIHVPDAVALLINAMHRRSDELEGRATEPNEILDLLEKCADLKEPRGWHVIALAACCVQAKKKNGLRPTVKIDDEK